MQLEQERKEKEMKEQIKLNEKLSKQEANLEKFEVWIKRQAEQDEIKQIVKKEKEQREKEEKIKKQMHEQERKQVANNAFRHWAESKVKTDKSMISKQEQLTTQNKPKDRPFKVPIGPYSNAKGLRDIQSKLNNLNSTEMEYQSDDQDYNEEIQEIEEGQYEEEFQKKGGSLQDISSINKFSNPEIEQ
jgi:hypothetical protein